MKLTRIQVEECGLWHDLDLPVNRRGLSVFYGPNEAGKSTLMRFIRGTLYGHEQYDQTSRAQRRAGAINVLHHGQTYQIARTYSRHGERSLAINGLEDAHSNQRLLDELLQGVSRDIYENVYAVGLRELQELSTLRNQDVTDRIYGLSLGPRGRQLIEAERLASQKSTKLLSTDENNAPHGELLPLANAHANLRDREKTFAANLTAYQNLLDEEQEVRVRIADQKKRQAGLNSELRGHKLLLQAWSPWNRTRTLRHEIEQLPDPQRLTPARIQEINRLEEKLATLERRKSELRGELRGMKDSLARANQNSAFRQNAASIEALLDQREWIENAEKHLGVLKADSSLLKVELDEKVAAIGPRWTLDRLQSVDTSPQAHFKLVETARSFQASMSRRARRRKKYQKLSNTCSRRQSDYNDRIKKLGITSLDKSIHDSESRLKDLEKLSGLRVREAELTQQAKNICRQLTRIQTRITLPWWAWMVLWVFAISGIALFVAGLYKAVFTAWFIGLIYVLTGLVCGGLTWALRLHYEADVKRQIESLQAEQHQTSDELSDVKAEIDELMNRDYPWLVSSLHETDRPVPLTAAHLTADATAHLAELRKLERLDKWIAKTRHKLSVLRGTLPHYQREVSNARQRWCELLKEVGLEETVRVNEAFDVWHKAYEADRFLGNWNVSKRDIDRQKDVLSMFRDRMEQLAARMDIQHTSDQSLVDLLNRWEDQLSSYQQYRDQYTLQRQQWSRKKKEWTSLGQQITDLNRKLRTEFRRAGVRSRTGLEQLLKQLERRSELESQLATSDAELTALAETEPELAIVESDLVAFEEHKTREHIEYLSLELEDLEQDLQRSHEELGTIQEKRISLEQDRSEVEARSERHRLESRFVSSLEQWVSTDLAMQSIVDLQHKFERDCQPRALVDASDYLSTLTQGRYQRLWSKLGTHELRLDDDRHESFEIEQLSSGTREQLFLSLRLAMIEESRESGVELPVVLDDVFVNFDQQRTEAAVQTLIDFAESGQQVLLFTCHQHLADMFQSEGVETTRLPYENRVFEKRHVG